MQIEEQIQGAVTVLRPQGPLVKDDAKSFLTRATEVLKKSIGRMVVDGSAIAYVDSTGLESLLDLTEVMTAGGRVLKLCGLNETVREVLDLTDLAESFELYEDTNTAVRSFL